MISQLAKRFSQEIEQALPKITELIPSREAHIAFQAALAKLDLVTREEFDAQTAVLQRTRAKLEALEAKCAEMEQKLNSEK
jgi:ubiquinone biosynthesis accessory factor UbiK